MSTYPTNGHWEDDPDWQAALDYAADLERHPYPLRDLRSPCGNGGCDQLCESVYCSETCRELTEGPDHEIDDDEPQLGAAPALGEAPVSMNVHIPVCGRDVLVTLRGVDEQEVLARLETLLRRYPVEAPAAALGHTGGDWCPMHTTQMKEQHGKDGSTWFSHKVGESWCKGKASGGPRHG